MRSGRPSWQFSGKHNEIKAICAIHQLTWPNSDRREQDGKEKRRHQARASDWSASDFLPSAPNRVWLARLRCFSMITICRDGASRPDPRCAARPRRAGSRGGPEGRPLGPVRGDVRAGVVGKAARHRLLAHAARARARVAGRFRQRSSRPPAEVRRTAGPSSPPAEHPALRVPGRCNICSAISGKLWTRCCAREE